MKKSDSLDFNKSKSELNNTIPAQSKAGKPEVKNCKSKIFKAVDRNRNRKMILERDNGRNLSAIYSLLNDPNFWVYTARHII